MAGAQPPAPARATPGRDRSIRRRWQAGAEWGAAAGGLAWLGLQLARPDPRIGDDDFGVFYAGAQALAQGGSPYVGDFVSPPWFALYLLPLTLLPVDVARALWVALNLAGLAAALVLCARLLRLQWPPRRRLLAATIFALWPPVEFGLRLGQNSLLVWLALLLALHAARRQHPFRCGIWLVLGLVKPQLVWLVALALLVWLRRRDQGARLLLGLLASLALLAGTVAVLAPGSYSDIASLRPAPWNYWGSNVSLLALLALLLGQSPLAFAAYTALAGAGTIAVLDRWRRAARPWDGLAPTTAAATLLLTPYAYPYDAVLLMLPVLAIARAVERSPFWQGWRRWALAGGLGLALVVLLQPANYTPSRFLSLLAPAIVLGALWLAGWQPAQVQAPHE